MENRHILIILDGWGLAEDPSVSAVDAAETPFVDSLFDEHPHGTLQASGEAVGLPEGQMGNSEVGHMNLGAGRRVDQDITRINKAIEDESFFENDKLRGAARHAAENDSKLHLMGLFSDGGVHSTNEHLLALLELAQREGLSEEQVCVHTFTDGRDTDPKGGVGYARDFRKDAEAIGLGQIDSIVGRYYAMDRDERWDRTERAYRLLTEREGKAFDDPIEALEASYAGDTTDEFVEPLRIDREGRDPRIADGDAVVFYNFRSDRARQLTHAFTDDDFAGFDRDEPIRDLHFVTMTRYEDDLDVPVAFPDVNLEETMGEVVTERGGKQLRIAETEKYAHVTYFFSGGREDPFEGEDEVLVPSPKVATYDMQPEMSAPEVADKASAALADEKYHFVCLNFANPDMVGHTGDFDAAVAACEAVDDAARQVIEVATEHGYGASVIADHGNADKLRNPDGSPHTAHTTALVPHIIIKNNFDGPVRDGKLGDVVPTILALMEEDRPDEMTGEVLV
jgi:2,3-bisphosphoglycerate-independent phosphoglycerate mutase